MKYSSILEGPTGIFQANFSVPPTDNTTMLYQTVFPFQGNTEKENKKKNHELTQRQLLQRSL